MRNLSLSFSTQWIKIEIKLIFLQVFKCQLRITLKKTKNLSRRRRLDLLHKHKCSLTWGQKKHGL